MYSESRDHEICDIQPSEPAFDEAGLVDLEEKERIECVADGDVSTSHVLAIWNESALRTISRSSTAVRTNWAPGLNATRPEVCLYISVKSIGADE